MLRQAEVGRLAPPLVANPAHPFNGGRQAAKTLETALHRVALASVADRRSATPRMATCRTPSETN